MTDASVIRDDCPGCQHLLDLLERSEEANAELGRQVAGHEHNLRRAASAETALRRELANLREEEPEAKEVREVLDYWKFRLGHQRAKTPLTGARAKKVRARLHEKFTVADLKKAIDGCARLPYVGAGGRKPNGTAKERYDELTIICESEAHVERFMSYADDQSQAAPAVVSGPGGVDAILAKLDAKKLKPGQWEAKCPVHDDRHASLSIGQGDKGAVLHCHAGCSPDAIVQALGLSMSTLFDPGPPKVVASVADTGVLPGAEDLERFQARLQQSPALLDRLLELRGWTREALATLHVGYDGQRLVLPVREQRGLLVNVLRYVPRKVDNQPKLLGAKGRPRDLWPAPEAVEPDDVIWLVEGEPDAISGWTLGLATVAVPGANGWRTVWASRFQGRDVVICMDCDQPGRQLAQRVHASLLPVADVRVLDLEPERTDGYDLSDALLEGATGDSLRALADGIVSQQVAA